MPLELDDSADDLVGLFEHDEVLAGDQRDNCIRTFLDRSDQFSIEHEFLPVEPCDGDHGTSFYREREVCLFIVQGPTTAASTHLLF